MPPDIPPEVYAWLMANMQSLPEWSKSSGYEPMDLSSQAKGLNFQQDFQNFLFDPQFAMQAGSAAYDPYSMQLAMQEYQPAMTAGEDKLVNVIQRSPASPEALVAMALLGVDQNLQPVAPPMDARSAVQQAKTAWEAAGNKGWPEPDSKGNDSMASFAQSSWDALMSDTPQRGTSDPFTKAGFTSPEARFDEQFFDPSGRVAGMEAKTKAAQEKAMKARGAESTYLANSQPGLRANQMPGAPAAPKSMGGPEMMLRQAMGNIMPFNSHPVAANPTIAAAAANTRAASLDNASALERAKLDAKIRSTTDVHGSPFLMQLAQRQQQARQLGLIP